MIQKNNVLLIITQLQALNFIDTR